MVDIKEEYNKFEVWLSTQSKVDIAGLLLPTRNWSNIKTNAHEILERRYRWFTTIQEEPNIEIVMGDKVVTLEDISNHMVKYISKFEDEPQSVTLTEAQYKVLEESEHKRMWLRSLKNI